MGGRARWWVPGPGPQKYFPGAFPPPASSGLFRERRAARRRHIVEPLDFGLRTHLVDEIRFALTDEISFQSFAYRLQIRRRSHLRFFDFDEVPTDLRFEGLRRLAFIQCWDDLGKLLSHHGEREISPIATIGFHA